MSLLIQVKDSQELLQAEDGKCNSVFNIYYGQNRPLLPYISLSSLSSVLFLISLFCFSHFFCIDRNDRPKQLIDIELVSDTDFQDKKDLLPSTKTKPSIAKRTSPVVQSHGDLFAPPVFVIRVAGKENNSKDKAQENQKQEAEKFQKQDPKDNDQKLVYKSKGLVDFSDLTKRYLPLSAPLPVLQKKNARANQTQKSDTDLMEEVNPPELVEITENDGDSSKEIWQSGGQSSHGSGTPNSLTEYLKDLHKKLKHHWLPPNNSVHNIKIVFRLAKNGNLVSMQLIRSSGSTASDDSALKAIKEAAPFGQLPAEYTLPFLDLAYTFNYTADELKEMQRQAEDL